MKDVELGIGKIKNAWLAQITGSSIISVFVFLYLIIAKHLTDQELVSHAMKDITWLMELANLPQLKSLQILDVELGIGKTENVLPAQITGYSIISEFVFLYLIIAKLLIDQEPVFHAMKDIT